MRLLLLKSLLFSWFVLQTSGLSAQLNAPALKCLETMTNGDVLLSWKKPPDPNNQFDHYTLFISLNFQGPYFDFASVSNYNTENFLAPTPGVLLDTAYFFMNMSYDNGTDSTANSDTLASIFLQLNGQLNIASVAQLNWNQVFTEHKLSQVNGSYSIERNYNGSWDQIATVPIDSTSYNDPVSVCHGDEDSVLVTYRVSLEDATGCFNRSRERTGKFVDENAPQLPDIETVTVDTATNQAIICWYPSPDGDVAGYKIQEIEFGIFDTLYNTIGQTNDPSILSFLYPFSDAGNGVEQFIVIPFDSCLHSGNTIGNISGEGFNAVIHHTIFLESEWIPCEKAIRLKWNRYDGWIPGVAYYNVYGRIAGGPFNLLSLVPPSQLSFTHHVDLVDVNYEYIVEAVSVADQKPSRSNRIQIFAQYPALTSFIYFSNVSIEGDKVELTIFPDTLASDITYTLEKYDNIINNYLPLTTAKWTPGTEEIIRFDDFNPINPASKRYRVRATDSCGFDYDLSENLNTIALFTTVDQEENINTLNWNHFINWDGDVSHYNIYRIKDGDTIGFPIATVTPDVEYYEDNVADFIFDQGEFCYYIEAVENLNSYGFSKSSWSNRDCATQNPLIWIPNAIIIDGINNVFKPVAGFIDFDKYEMIIYNRWGQPIFNSSRIEEGWDGKYKGSYVQLGPYFYYIAFYTGEGRAMERRGYIMVIR